MLLKKINPQLLRSQEKEGRTSVVQLRVFIKMMWITNNWAISAPREDLHIQVRERKFYGL